MSARVAARQVRGPRLAWSQELLSDVGNTVSQVTAKANARNLSQELHDLVSDCDDVSVAADGTSSPKRGKEGPSGHDIQPHHVIRGYTSAVWQVAHRVQIRNLE
eukprot:177687_1